MTLLRRAVALLAAVVLGSFVLAAPAVAAPPPSCTNFSVCTYVNIGYRTNQGYELIPVRTGGTCEQTFYQNSISGVYNNSGRSIRLYKNDNCSGESMVFYNGTGHHQFSVRYPTWENDIESLKFL